MSFMNFVGKCCARRMLLPFCLAALAAALPREARSQASLNVTIDSNAAHDGWLQLNNTGGNTASTTALDAGGGSDGIRLGDAEWLANLDEGYRSILSFDTSVIPANATITQAQLQLTFTSMTGTIIAAFGPLRAEIRTGAFNGNLALENADHLAAGSSGLINIGAAPTVPTFPVTLTGGAGFINKSGGADGGFTQVRLSLSIFTNNNRNAFQTGDDRWNFASGNDGTAANRPKLIVTYTLPPDIDVSPGSLSFGSRDVNAGPTATQPVTIQNVVAGSTLNVTNVDLTGVNPGDFTENGGAVTLVGGASAVVDVAFDPTLPIGLKSAALRVQSNDADEGTVLVGLDGTALDQEIVISPFSVIFPDIDVDNGQTMPASTVTITNIGNTTLNISSVALGGVNPGDFVIVSDSGEPSLAPSADRTIDLAFDPTATGARSATLDIMSDDADEPIQGVGLSGNGLDQEVNYFPLSMDFLTKDVDDVTATPQTAFIVNIGDVDLAVSVVSIVGVDNTQFTISSDSGENPLTPGPPPSRAVQVDFFPTSPGVKNAALRIITDDSDEGTVDIPLTGEGIDQEITVAPLSLSFGNRNVDDLPSPFQSVTITNDGTSPLSLSVTLGGADALHFNVVGDTLENPLDPTETRTVDINFDPTSVGAKSAMLTILSNDNDEGVVNVALDGTGTAQEVDVSPTTIGFGTQNISAGPTASQDVTITNQGTGPLTITSVGLGGADFSQFTVTADSGEPTLNPTEFRTVSIAFDPTTGGAKSAVLTVNSDDNDEPSLDVTLSGTGLAGPSPTPSPSPSPTPSPTPNAAADWEIYE